MGNELALIGMGAGLDDFNLLGGGDPVMGMELLGGGEEGNWLLGGGEDELMGAEEEILVGMGASRPRARQIARGRAVARARQNALRRNQNLAMLAARGATTLPPGAQIPSNRLSQLPVNSPLAIAPGGTLIFFAQPMVPFQPSHMHITDTVIAGPLIIGSAFWQINDIRVGKTPVSPNTGAINGSTFAPGAQGNGFKWPFCPPLMPITFNVTLSAFCPAASIFQAALYGASAE
jgi:hypothetical protein